MFKKFFQLLIHGLAAKVQASQLRHVSTIGKKIVKQQYVLHMSHNMVNFGSLAAEIDPAV